MSSIPPATVELLSSEERWRRWGQRGRDNDLRFMLRARRLLWLAVVFAIGGGVILWLSR